MANSEWRLAENVAGRFFVTSECVDCDVCRELAPGIFRRDERSRYSIVHTQPRLPTELVLAREAIRDCPVDAIGEAPADG